MITAWRITKRKYVAVAFSGEGAELVGGRWNSPGTRIVYGSSSISLAILEILVHLQKDRLISSYCVIPAQFNPDFVEELNLAHLPSKWAAYPASLITQQMGDEWARSNRSPVLRVPSAIVPLEWNYLINPGHPEFNQILIGDPIQLPLDERLIAVQEKTP